eukprot:38478-Chlamydomonas_euryale.AAC.1
MCPPPICATPHLSIPPHNQALTPSEFAAGPRQVLHHPAPRVVGYMPTAHLRQPPPFHAPHAHAPRIERMSLQVRGSSFIIQRPESYTTIFPKLRQRPLHSRSAAAARAPLVARP